MIWNCVRFYIMSSFLLIAIRSILVCMQDSNNKIMEVLLMVANTFLFILFLPFIILCSVPVFILTTVDSVLKSAKYNPNPSEI